MNKLDTETRVRILNCLIEGVGINATCRMTGANKSAVLRLLGDVGDVCSQYQDEHLRALTCKRLQLDEIWSFCYSKEKNVPHEKRGIFGYGDVWTWTAIDAETKLVPSFYVGMRDAESARIFIDDLAGRVHGVPQITTDGLKVYISAIKESFGDMVDYAMLIKLYGTPEAGRSERYSPGEVIGCMATPISGEPDMTHVSTSFVERANLTMRMHMRRFTRLTNAHSKKIENHMHAIALWSMHYNYCKAHETLSMKDGKLVKRTTPAMAAGKADHVWTIAEVVGLLEAQELATIQAGKMKRGKYRSRNTNS